MSEKRVAVIMMTKSAALEMSPYGIRVVDDMKSKVMGNKLTQPEQVADTVYLLSLEEASAINGSVVMADEGYASFK